MSVSPPKTRGEAYAQLIEHARKVQELCAHMAHFHRTENSLQDRALANGWLKMSELMKRAIWSFTEMAKGNMS